MAAHTRSLVGPGGCCSNSLLLQVRLATHRRVLVLPYHPAGHVLMQDPAGAGKRNVVFPHAVHSVAWAPLQLKQDGWQRRQILLPMVVGNCPIGQLLRQRRLLTSLKGFATRHVMQDVPLAQLRHEESHGEHTGLLVPPSGQDPLRNMGGLATQDTRHVAQSRLEVAVGATAWYCPAAHCCTDLQALAPTWSWYCDVPSQLRQPPMPSGT